MMIDSSYWILFIVVSILPIWASLKLQNTFNKYSRVRSLSGYTGEEAARRILMINHLGHIGIKPVRGSMTDHYNPIQKEIGLSQTDLPASMPAFPPSRNWRFQFPMACSETFSRRAASAIVISPASTDNTMRSFFSAGIVGGRLITFRPFSWGVDQQRTTPAKHSDARHYAPTTWAWTPAAP